MTDLKPRTALEDVVLALPDDIKRSLFEHLEDDLHGTDAPPERHAMLESALDTLAAEVDADPSCAETWDDVRAVLRKYGGR